MGLTAANPQAAESPFANNRPVDFSLTRGGLTYRLWQKLHLLRPPFGHLVRRATALTLIAWFPLLLLLWLAGRSGVTAAVPFISDLQTHVRLLFCLPLLVLGEPFFDVRIKSAVRQFVDRNLVTGAERPRFDAIVDSTHRLRDSLWPEIVLIIGVYSIGHWLWVKNYALQVSSWSATVVDGNVHYSPAGYWLAFISVPLFQFLTLRWVWRILLWYQFLVRVWSMPLHLNLFHPDKAAGLGFLGTTGMAFAPFLVAESTVLASVIGNRILYSGMRLPDFKIEIAATVVLLTGSVIVPLVIFAGKLEKAKRQAGREFGVLASAYTNEFHKKWIHQGVPRTIQGIVGAEDFQALADLGNSYFYIREMRHFPFSKTHVARLAMVVVLPFAPLTLTMFPVNEVIDRLFKMLI
jgi:hypothetical protein